MTTTLPIPAQATYFSLLSAPDGHTLYIVDYFSAVLNRDLQLQDTRQYPQTIYKFDVDRRRLVDWSVFRRGGMKASPCAAALSPSGDRVYIASGEGPGAGGIDVIDTRSLERIARFLPERSFYCIAVDPDGQRFYASSGNKIVTGDTSTGTERATIQMTTDYGVLPIVMAVQKQ